MCACECHEDGEPWCNLCFDTFPHIIWPQAKKISSDSDSELIRLQGDEEGETQNNESICAKCDALVSVPNGMEFNGNAGDMCWPCTIATMQAQVETLKDNQWPSGDRPNPCCGISTTGINIYGDKDSINAVRIALHDQGNMPAYQEAWKQRLAAVEAQVETLTQQLKWSHEGFAKLREALGLKEQQLADSLRIDSALRESMKEAMDELYPATGYRALNAFDMLNAALTQSAEEQS